MPTMPGSVWDFFEEGYDVKVCQYFNKVFFVPYKRFARFSGSHLFNVIQT